MSLEQVSAGRPIPVLPQHTFPGNVVLSSRAASGLSPPVPPDAELERLCVAHLAAAARDALLALADAPSSSADDTRPGATDASDGSASDHMSGAPHVLHLLKGPRASPWFCRLDDCILLFSGSVSCWAD